MHAQTYWWTPITNRKLQVFLGNDFLTLSAQNLVDQIRTRHRSVIAASNALFNTYIHYSPFPNQSASKALCNELDIRWWQEKNRPAKEHLAGNISWRHTRRRNRLEEAIAADRERWRKLRPVVAQRRGTQCSSVHVLSPDQKFGIHCLIICRIHLLTPNNLGGTWRRICSPDIWTVSALEVLRNRAV